MVEKRYEHFSHSLRRLMEVPSPETRESTTLLSSWLQTGQRITNQNYEL